MDERLKGSARRRQPKHYVSINAHIVGAPPK